MRLRRMVMAGMLAATMSMGSATPARALTQGEEAGFAFLATVANLFYTPAKVTVAALALPVGAFSGWVGGGDTRSAYSVWVPAVGGTYFLTTGHMAGETPIEFWGHDYADTPSTMSAETDGTFYESEYQLMR